MTVNLIATAAVALGTTLMLVPASAGLGRRLGAIDLPGPLAIHVSAIPRSGGAAMLAGVLTIVPSSLLGGAPLDSQAVRWIAAATLFFAVGFVDDVKRQNPALKLALQLAAGCIVLIAGGPIPVASSGIIDALLTALVPVAAANAMNLIDGMDGLAVGIAFVSASFLALGDPSAVGHATAIVVVSAAFFVYNRPKAPVFMGDGGSNMLGALLGVASLELAAAWKPPAGVVAVPCFLGFLTADASAAVLRRVVMRSTVSKGDRFHSYDLLRARGWSSWRVMAFCLACAALGGLTGLAARVSWAGGLALGVALWVAFLAIFITLVSRERTG